MVEKADDGCAILEFGDIVDFGERNPDTGEIDWYQERQVVMGHGSSDRTVFAAPTFLNDKGEECIAMPGTTFGTYVRCLGKLTVDEVAQHLRRAWTPAKGEERAEHVVSIYMDGEPEQPKKYIFKLIE